LRKISAKDPYMVLEAFLLIHIGGSIIFFDEKSNDLLLFKPTNRIPQSEFFNNPDSIKKSDSIEVNKGTSLKFDSLNAFNTNLLITTRSKINTIAEISNTAKVTELAIPEFALTSEENLIRNYPNAYYKLLKIKTLQSKHILFKQKEPVRIDDKIMPDSRIRIQRDWFSIILLFAVLLIAWIRGFFGRYFLQSIQSLFDFTLSTRLYRNRNVLLPRISFLLLINFIIITSLYTFKFLEIINVQIFKASFSNFLLLNAIFLVMILLRFISFHSLHILFPKDQLILEYHYQVQNFYKSIGLLVLPILIIATYFPSRNNLIFIWFGLGLIVLLYVYRLFRGQRIIHRKNFSISYLLLYIITFEILPISICFKVFSEMI
jgi:hypothetical protein